MRLSQIGSYNGGRYVVDLDQFVLAGVDEVRPPMGTPPDESLWRFGVRIGPADAITVHLGTHEECLNELVKFAAMLREAYP